MLRARPRPPPSCCGCRPSLREPARGRRHRPAQARSSSTRRIRSSPMRPTPWSTTVEQVVRLIRSKARGHLLRHPEPDLIDPRHASSASSATACSMPCAPSARATRRRCSAPRPRPSAPGRSSLRHRQGDRRARRLARPWSRCARREGRAPLPVERALIAPPAPRLGTLDAEARRRPIAASPLCRQVRHRHRPRTSAYEQLAGEEKSEAAASSTRWAASSAAATSRPQPRKAPRRCSLPAWATRW